MKIKDHSEIIKHIWLGLKYGVVTIGFMCGLLLIMVSIGQMIFLYLAYISPLIVTLILVCMLMKIIKTKMNWISIITFIITYWILYFLISIYVVKSTWHWLDWNYFP